MNSLAKLATVIKIDEAKRFGFAKVSGIDRGVFFHFDSLPVGCNNPKVGTTLRGVITDNAKGPRLDQIELIQLRRTDPYVFYGLAAIATWLVMSAVIWKYSTVSLLGAGIVGLNVAAFVFMSLDKSLARSGALRTPETVLYLLAILGGSPGIFLGMHIFKHKSSKAQFNFVMLLVIAVQLFLIRYLELT